MAELGPRSVVRSRPLRKQVRFDSHQKAIPASFQTTIKPAQGSSATRQPVLKDRPVSAFVCT